MKPVLRSTAWNVIGDLLESVYDIITFHKK